MEAEGEPPKKSIGIQITFIFYGIASLLGWNALLTKLDFFSYFLKDMKPNTTFSFLNFFLNIVFQFILIIKKDLFPLKLQLIVGIVGSILFLIGIPVSTMFLPKNEMINFIVTGGLVLLMGFINALASGSFFNYVSHFPLELIVAFSGGQGFSGIAMNVLEYIVLLSLNGEEENLIVLRAWIFFGISALILVVCLILLLYNYNSEYCRYYLSKGMEKENIPEGSLIRESQANEEEQQNIINEQTEENQIIQQNEENNGITEDKNTSSNSKSLFIILFKKIWDLDILMVYIYIVTFALFPNASLCQELFNFGIYKSNTIIIIYNTFDTIGRYLVKILPKKKIFNTIIILGRSVLLFTLVFNYYCQERLDVDLTITSILLIVNVALLALTNGIGTTLTFGIAPDIVEDEYKGPAGTSVSFFLIVGIFLGSCVNFGVERIIAMITKEKNK